MKPSACTAFQREFAPGLRSPHFEVCPSCRRWALEVESWRALGVRAPLPAPVRARLVSLPEGTPAFSPATRLPLPMPLRSRLVGIPAAARVRHRVMKARYVVAASYLLAGLLALAAGKGPSVLPPVPPAARTASRGVAEASVRGTRLLLQVGDWVYEGCARATRSAEELLDQIATRPREKQPPPPPPDPE